MATLTQVRAILRDLIGKPCFSALGGPGEPLVLDLGDRRRRSLRLKNPSLSFDKRTFEGAVGLFVDCAWALDGPQGRVVTSFEATLREGPPLVEVLEGDRIKTVRLPAPGMDPVIGWKSGHVLRILATRVDPRARRANWAVWSTRGMLAIGPGGRIQGPPKGPRKPPKDGDLVAVWRARWRAANKTPKAEEE